MDWQRIELGKVAEVKSSKRIFAHEYIEDGVPFFRSKEIGELSKGDKIETELFISPKRYDDIKLKFGVPNVVDMLLTSVGSIGNTWIVDNRTFYYKDGNITQLIPTEKLDVNFLQYYFSSKLFSGAMSSNSSGTAYNALTIAKINKLQIPLPPLPIQKKIAAILDAADAYRQKTKALIEKYDQLTQSLFLEMFGDPVRNERGWEVEKLVTITSKIGSGATPRGGKDSYQTSGISLIRSLNVHDHKFKLKDLAFIDDIQADALNNVIVEERDVLFNITGASVCRCCIVPTDLLPARVNQHVAIIRPLKTKLSPIFLTYYMTTPSIKRQLLENSIRRWCNERSYN
ncbi:MAG: restriction endonuclease subunit S [Saprospiraceae bacterium]|nr:restriction endonuclease subunit S [Saprospiraceae bacterium]